jgi:biotin carboxyl carrier protein
MYQVTINSGESLQLKETSSGFAPSSGNHEVDLFERKEGEYHLLVDGQSMLVHIDKVDVETKTLFARVNGKPCTIEIKDKMDLLLKSMGLENAMVKKMNELKAPMPGLVLDVLVQPGAAVEKGDPLLVLEAMKMENVIKAAGDGTVKEIKITAKDAVDKNQVMITFE